MNQRKKLIVSITGIFIVLLALLGLTYAYFLTRITGNENDKSISVTSANLQLTYGGDNGSIIGDGELIEPGKIFDAKTFTVTNNGNKTIDNYAVILENVKTYYNQSFVDDDGNQIESGTTTSFVSPEDFEITINCTGEKINSDTGVSEPTPCSGTKGTLPLMESETLDETYITNGILVINEIQAGETQTYSVVLEYKETNTDQSDDMNKSLEGKFNIIDLDNTVEIVGNVTTYNPGDSIVTNSVKRESQINSDGSYKIVGLETDVHSINKKNGNTETEIGKISIVKGNEIRIGQTTINGVIVPEVTITDSQRKVNIDISNNNIDIKEIEFDTNMLNGVTVSQLKATDEENQVNGLVLYENFEDAYNALRDYWNIEAYDLNDIGKYDINLDIIPEELTYTFYGKVNVDSSLRANLTGGIRHIRQNLNGDKLNKINIIGGNGRAEIITSFNGTFSTGSSFDWARVWADDVIDFSKEKEVEINFKKLRFESSFIITRAGARLTVEDCIFENNTFMEFRGNSTIKNNKFIYNGNNDSSHYGVFLYTESVVSDSTTLNFDNNYIYGSPRGINIATAKANINFTGNTIKNIQLGARGAIQFSSAKNILFENNNIDINGNAFYFHDTFAVDSILIMNNDIKAKYAGVFGDDEDTLDESVVLPTVSSCGNNLNIEKIGYGITKQGTEVTNSFVLSSNTCQ